MDGQASKSAEIQDASTIAALLIRQSTPALLSPAPSPQPSPHHLHPVLAFRTRVGRSNRYWLDRRTTSKSDHATLADLDPNVADRMKYDSDNDEDDGDGGFVKDLLYPVDHYSDDSMRVRAAFAVGSRREGVGQDGRRVSGGPNNAQAMRSGAS